MPQPASPHAGATRLEENIMEKSRIEQVLAAHKEQGLDCCEAVFATYHDLLNVPHWQARAIGHCYGCNTGINGVFDSYEDLHFFRYMHVCAGYGIDNMFGNCGALCGAQLCAAVKENPICGEVPHQMMKPCALTKEMERRFQEETGHLSCEKIRNRPGSTLKIYGCDAALRFCAKMVEDLVFPGVFEPVEL